MRLLIGFVLDIVFAVWVLYHLLLKQDLKQHLTELYAGLFFLAIWALIYWWLLS